MKTIVIKSNHGNHTGFNRKWEVLNKGYSFDNKQDASIYLGTIADELDELYDEQEKTFIAHGALLTFENDLCYYYVVTQYDYDNGLFDGGHYGYANTQIKAIFEVC